MRADRDHRRRRLQGLHSRSHRVRPGLLCGAPDGIVVSPAAQLTAGQDVKIIKDLGLASSSAIGLFIATFFGIGLVTKEVERRSIYSLLSKPVTRSAVRGRANTSGW